MIMIKNVVHKIVNANTVKRRSIERIFIPGLSVVKHFFFKRFECIASSHCNKFWSPENGCFTQIFPELYFFFIKTIFFVVIPEFSSNIVAFIVFVACCKSVIKLFLKTANFIISFFVTKPHFIIKAT